jgi:hypothetical protein
MIRWFTYGFGLTMGMFVACALSDKIDQWRRREDGEESLFV